MNRARNAKTLKNNGLLTAVTARAGQKTRAGQQGLPGVAVTGRA